MRIAVAALILVFLLSTAICKGEENRDQKAEEDPATENFYLELLQVLENFYLELLQFLGTLVLLGTLAVLLGTLANFVGMDCMVAMLLFAGWLYETLRRYRALQR